MQVTGRMLHAAGMKSGDWRLLRRKLFECYNSYTRATSFQNFIGIFFNFFDGSEIFSGNLAQNAISFTMKYPDFRYAQECGIINVPL